MALNHREMILLAALEFQDEFTMGDLVDAVWRLFPNEFQLKGYELPNSGAVECKVYGLRGLVGRGLLEQVSGDKRFVVTQGGREYQPGQQKLAPAPLKRPPEPPKRTLDPPVPRPLWANHLPFR